MWHIIFIFPPHHFIYRSVSPQEHQVQHETVYCDNYVKPCLLALNINVDCCKNYLKVPERHTVASYKEVWKSSTLGLQISLHRMAQAFKSVA